MIYSTENKINVTIKNFQEPILHEKFSKANKKLSKLNQEIKILSRKERVEEYKVRDNWTGETITMTQKYIDFEISKPEIIKRENTEYVGCINRKDGLTVYNTKPEEYVLAKEPERCDHCHITRMRNKYFFFLENGELKSIGSSCVNQYFGYNLISILTIWDNTTNISEEEYFGGCGYGSQDRELHFLVNIVDYLTFIQKGHWKKGEVWNFLSFFGKRISDLTDYDKKMQRDFYDYLRNRESKNFFQDVKERIIKEYINKELKNDFDCSVDNALFETVNGEKIIRSRISLKQVGIAGYAIYKVLTINKEAEKKEEKKVSSFVGNIKERIGLKVKVLYTTVVSSCYGDSLLIKFIDDNGNIFTWFNSGNSWGEYEIGRTLKVKATIKKHETYHNEKVTYLTRVKTI